MQKTLVLYARICPGESHHTKRLFEMIKNFEGVTAVQVDGKVPFDPVKEQEFVKQFDHIVFLFTMNWFNIPWNLSRYLAEVWRVGDFKLTDKKIYLIVTTGSSTEFYANRTFGWNAHEYLNNIHGVVQRLRAINGGEWIYHGASTYDPERFSHFLDTVREGYETTISQGKIKDLG